VSSRQLGIIEQVGHGLDKIAGLLIGPIVCFSGHQQEHGQVVGRLTGDYLDKIIKIDLAGQSGRQPGDGIEV